MLLFALLANLAFAADCSAPVAPSQLTASVEDAMLSFATMDEEGFATASQAATAAIPCLSAPLSPAEAAAYHRMAGLGAFFDGDVSAAKASLRAAATLQPDFVFSAKIAPEGGKLATLYTEAQAAGASKTTGLPIPSDGTLLFDGAKSNRRPTEVPTLMQFVVGDAARVSALLAPGAPMPSLSGVPAPAPAPAPAPEPAPVAPPPPPAPVAPPPPPAPVEPPPAPAPVVEAPPVAPPIAPPPPAPPGPVAPPAPTPLPTAPAEKGRGKGLLVAGLVGGGVAGGLYGVSAMSRMAFDEAPSAQGKTLTNGAYVASVGTAAVSTVLVAAWLAGGK